MTPLGRWLRRLLIRPFVDMRLRNKLFVVLGLVSVGPMLFFGVYSYEKMKSELTRQTFAGMELTTAQISTNLKMKLGSYSSISSSLYLDPRLRDYLSQDYSNGTGYVDAYSYIDNTFRNMLVTNTDISGITVYTNNDTLPVDEVYVKRLDEDAKRSPWYAAASKSYGSVSFTAMPACDSSKDGGEGGGIPVVKPSRIVLARLLNNNSLNYPYGILTMEIPESDIYALMEKENKNKDLFIVSPDGTIISGQDKSKLNRKLDEFVVGLKFEGAVGSFIGQYDGEKVYVVYNAIDNGWRTVSIVSYSSLLANINIAFSRLLTIAIASLALSVVLIYVTSRLFTKRIERLLLLTRRLEREDFKVPELMAGHDEIGQLSFAMVKMAGRMKELINEVYKKEIAKKEAEMNMLQAQINPHFLYNTLASISALAMRSGDSRIQDMVTHLAKFYRISLNKGKTIVSLGEELRLTKSYISIQQLRFGGLIHLHYDVDEAASPYPVVKLMLQPFIENAIHHAIWDDEAGINIIIKARIDGELLLLEVIDDGMGMRPETLERIQSADDSISSGYGIRNVDRRIKVTFGDDYGVRTFSRFGIGTTVQIRLPLRGPL
ncbi:sensor histidine kinase [Cohnella xylanilytica]|uniref:Sensor histidine kinase n=1 Tax=Cohnella xylanilytica TaxID=557555 RepID=A0A841U6C7_9BACL|nr:sensor histidine kinase [Cohnella xylanilytica]MBB6693550.1 sensor histidine kinase [Cohnella xylanilytica]